MNIITSKSAFSKMLAVAIIVIIVIAAAAGVYYYTTMQNPSNSPSPSASSTPSASPSGSTNPSSSASPTVAPSVSASATPAPSTQPIANFRAGAYANYTLKTYDNETGNLTAEMPYNWEVSDGTYNGTSCWLLLLTTQTVSGNDTAKIVILSYIDKSTTQAIHMTLTLYTNEVVTYTQEIDPTTAGSGGAPSAVNPSNYVGQESVTVSAGTFTCEKATTTTGLTVASVWVNSNVSIFGIVKSQEIQTSNNVVISTTELTAYGG